LFNVLILHLSTSPLPDTSISNFFNILKIHDSRPFPTYPLIKLPHFPMFTCALWPPLSPSLKSQFVSSFSLPHTPISFLFFVIPPQLPLPSFSCSCFFITPHPCFLSFLHRSTTIALPPSCHHHRTMHHHHGLYFRWLYFLDLWDGCVFWFVFWDEMCWLFFFPLFFLFLYMGGWCSIIIFYC